MTPQQPYFPPPTHNLSTIWRKNKLLVMTKQAMLPNRCIKCNERADTYLKRNLRWHHPALYLLIFGGVLFYIIFALVISKTATVTVGLCADHSAARKRDLMICWALVLGSFVSVYLTVATNEPFFLLLGVVMFLGGVIYAVVKARVVAPQKIDNQFVWLHGVTASYLQEFPEWTGAA